MQTVQGAGGDLGVIGTMAGLKAHAGAEIHQAATQAEQHGSQVRRGLRGDFGVRHVNVPEIASRLEGDGDS
ncbi:hypothetical protein D3C81_2140720 [compost metagenome]